MSPTLSGISAVWHVKLGDALEILDGIIFDFYPGLPHIHNMTSPFYLICCIAVPEGENEILGVFWSQLNLHQVTK